MKRDVANGTPRLNTAPRSVEIDQNEIDFILQQLPRMATRELFNDFLKSKELPRSQPSWDKLIEQTVKPAISDGTLDLASLAVFVNEMEEHGQQHVFLYQLEPARVASLFNQEELTDTLSQLTQAIELNQRSKFELLEQPALVEVRATELGDALVFKIASKREDLKEIRVDESGDIVTKTLQKEHYRAVDIARVWNTGLVELRVHRQSQAANYLAQLTGLLQHLKPFFLAAELAPHDVAAMRSNLWSGKSRGQTEDHIALRHSEHKNGQGNKLSIAAGADGADLWSDTGATEGVGKFNASSNRSSCDRAELIVSSEDNDIRAVNMSLRGEDNEFVISGRCTKAEYENVLTQVIRLAKLPS